MMTDVLSIAAREHLELAWAAQGFFWGSAHSFGSRLLNNYRLS